MTHIWMRAETRENEARFPLTPDGVGQLIAAGMTVTVEDSDQRCTAIEAYADAGALVAAQGSWPDAPLDAVVLGLKELPDNDAPLRHRHIMFGHAFKGQPDGPRLLQRFVAGGGRLWDLEYLTDASDRRLVAFGHWAGFAGAVVAARAWAAQARGIACPAVTQVPGAQTMIEDALCDLGDLPKPRVIIIGAHGRVGRGAAEACGQMGLDVTPWDMAETAHGGPYPEILTHGIFLNCILAAPGTPVFVPPSARHGDRALRVIGDIACDPGSAYSPVPLYDQATSWTHPITRVAQAPVLDIMAIDNLPSLMPRDSSLEFAKGLLPLLLDIPHDQDGVWARADGWFERKSAVHR